MTTYVLLWAFISSWDGSSSTSSHEFPSKEACGNAGRAIERMAAKGVHPKWECVPK